MSNLPLEIVNKIVMMTARDTTYPFMAQLKQVFNYHQNTFKYSEHVYATDLFDGVFNANGYEFVGRYPPFTAIYKKDGIFYRYEVEFIDVNDDIRVESARMIYDNNLNQVDDDIDDILLTDIGDGDDELLSDISDDDE